MIKFVKKTWDNENINFLFSLVLEEINAPSILHTTKNYRYYRKKDVYL